jgi:hypothetical protein
VFAAAAIPLIGAVLFVATHAHGNESSKLISQTSSIQVTPTAAAGPGR